MMTTNSKASATARPTATTATVSALPSSGGHPIGTPITLVAVLVLVAFVAWPYLRQAASGLPAEVEFLEVGPTGQHVGGNLTTVRI